MTVPGYLAIARAAQAESMTATCTITRPGTGGERVFDEATGTYSDPEPDVIYSGRCKVKSTNGARSLSEAEAGERRVTVLDLTLNLPIDAASGAVRRDDVARIDFNPDDPALIGRNFVIRAGSHATTKTARRLPIEEVA